MNTSNSFASTPAFFEAKYKKNEDPWRFSSKLSELSRYDAIIGALSHRRYSHAFEPGCSIGVLTERLASLCETLEAIDFSSTAVTKAQERCASLPHVQISCASLPQGKPRIPYDLLVLSEIGYYFDEERWRAVFDLLVEPMRKGSTILAAHWLGYSKDHCISGDQVHAMLNSHSSLLIEHSKRHRTFRLDRFVKQ